MFCDTNRYYTRLPTEHFFPKFSDLYLVPCLSLILSDVHRYIFLFQSGIRRTDNKCEFVLLHAFDPIGLYRKTRLRPGCTNYTLGLFFWAEFLHQFIFLLLLSYWRGLLTKQSLNLSLSLSLFRFKMRQKEF